MYKVYIMRGIPGSGKSYQAKHIIAAAEKDNKSTRHCSADLFFVKDNKYNFDPKLINNAHIFCMNQFLTALLHCTEVIVVDNTHTQIWEYTPYLQVAQCYGYDIEIIEVYCDQQKAFKRQIHNVPAKQHQTMANRFQKVLPHHKQFIKKDIYFL